MNGSLERLNDTAVRDFVACRYCRRITPSQKLSVLKLQDFFGTYQLRCPECNILLGKTHAAPIPTWLFKVSVLTSLFPIGLWVLMSANIFLYDTALLWIIATVCFYYRPNFVIWNMNAVRLPPGTHSSTAVLSA